MRSFLLFVFLLNTESVSTNVLGCSGGWVEFKWTYSDPPNKNKDISVPPPVGSIKSTKNDQWEEVHTKYFLYNNTTGKYLRMIVKQIQKDDFGKSEFKGQPAKTFSLENGGSVCLQDPVCKTTDPTADTTISCTHSDLNFICKESLYTCDMIQCDPATVYTISGVSLQDQGVYWCGYESLNDGYRVSRQKVDLKVKASATLSSPSSTAQNTVTTSVSKTVTPTQTVRKKTSSTLSTPSSTAKNTVTTSVSKTVTPTQTVRNNDDFWKYFALVTAVCGTVVLLVIAAICLNKRLKRSKITKPDDKEEHCYEEIQERPLTSGSGTALKTIYATATFHTEDSAEPSSTTTTSTTTTTNSTNTTTVYSTVKHHPSENVDSSENDLNTTTTSDDMSATNVIYSTVKPLKELTQI